jgi:hypothetical protein
MRKFTICLFALTLGGTCLAQQWEIGGAAGFAFYKNMTVTRASGTASAGFKDGAAFSAFGTQNLYNRLGGQFRYTYQMSDLMVSSGGTEATFGGRSQAFHYDLLFYATDKESKVRPFAAAGGGVKLYQGTGKETVTQPHAQFAILTKTSQLEGLISVGGGVKYKLGDRTFLNLEIRDYITPAPKNVIAPYTGSKMTGWVHSFLPMVGLSFGF